MRAYVGMPWAVIAPGKSLLKQTLRELREALPDREIKLIGAGSRVKYQSDDINLVSMDSAHKLDAAAIRGVIADETHALMSEGRSTVMLRFPLARKLAVGATLEGRYDGRDAMLEGLFGPMLAHISYKEAVRIGAVCQLLVMMVRIPLPLVKGDRDRIYRDYILRNDKLHHLIGRISREFIPQEDQTLIFIKQVDQAERIQRHTGTHVPLVIDKLLTDKERDELTRQTAENEIQRVICSDIFVQGVTFHDIRYLINCNGGGPSTGCLQRPGRLAEIRPDKRFGVMIDMKYELPKKGMGESRDMKLYRGVAALQRESNQRLQVYQDTGYLVDVVEVEEVGDWIKKHNTHE